MSSFGPMLKPDGWIESADYSTVSYDSMKYAFAPGDLVLREDAIGNLWLFEMIRITYLQDLGLVDPGGQSPIEKRGKFETWSLSWDAVQRHLTKRYMTFTCDEFPGERDIKSLPVYPIAYYVGDTEGEKIEDILTDRGKRWWEFIAKSPIYQQHSGPALSDGGKIRIKGRVVIDDKSKDSNGMEAVLRSKIQRERNSIDLEEEYIRDGVPEGAGLTDAEARLCPAVIGCFDLKNKKKFFVGLDDLTNVKWNENAMNQLVLDDAKKNMLQGLVRHHSNRDPRSEADLIAGKGQSLVVLLHGPPGVGKTLTAESIAESAAKPLIAMSIGEMVWEETKLQERLRSEFQRAIDWNAVLLLDEADVVLEARSFEDVRRNGIVSIFLRELEYYQGILFLTTNRVSTMDTAFQSRIQIGISFQNMTSKTRKDIWKQLLTLNHRGEMIGHEGRDRVEKELSKYELNGRQIRNALNVAEGLAFQQHLASQQGGKEPTLQYHHIEQAVRAADEFQRMLEKSKSMIKHELSVWSLHKGGDDDVDIRY